MKEAISLISLKHRATAIATTGQLLGTSDFLVPKLLDQKPQVGKKDLHVCKSYILTISIYENPC